MNRRIAKIFRILNRCKVRYCLIGRMAANLFGLQSMTYDVDIVIKAGKDNAVRLFRAMRLLGSQIEPPSGIEMELFLTEKVTRFDVGGMVLDVIKWQEGFSASSWRRIIKVPYAGTFIPVADLHDLIQTKEGTGRRKDRADVRRLREIMDRQGKKRGRKA